MNRRESHYKNVVQPDRIIRYNHNHINNVADLKRITVGQSIRPRNFQSEYRPIAQCCIRLITGQQPIVVRTSKSVSDYRRIRGQAVAVKTYRTGHKIYQFRDQRNTNVRTKRPYAGISESKIDKDGNFTINRKNALAFSVLEDYFDLVNQICSAGGLYVTVETKSKTREEAISLFSALKVPRVKEKIK